MPVVLGWLLAASLPLVVAQAVVTLWALIAVLLNNDRYRNGNQLVWVVVVLLAGVVGALLYVLIGRQPWEVVSEAVPGRRQRLAAIRDPWGAPGDHP